MSSKSSSAPIKLSSMKQQQQQKKVRLRDKLLSIFESMGQLDKQHITSIANGILLRYDQGFKTHKLSVQEMKKLLHGQRIRPDQGKNILHGQQIAQLYRIATPSTIAAQIFNINQTSQSPVTVSSRLNIPLQRIMKFSGPEKISSINRSLRQSAKQYIKSPQASQLLTSQFLTTPTYKSGETNTMYFLRNIIPLYKKAKIADLRKIEIITMDQTLALTESLSQLNHLEIFTLGECYQFFDKVLNAMPQSIKEINLLSGNFPALPCSESPERHPLPLPLLPNLSVLNVKGCDTFYKYFNDAAQWIGTLPSLRKLEIMFDDSYNYNFSLISHWQQLHELTLSRCLLTESLLLAISELTELTTLTLEFCELARDALPFFSKLNKLKNLSIHRTMGLSIPLKELSKFTNLNELSLRNCSLNDRDIPLLLQAISPSNMPDLKYVDLSTKTSGGFSKNGKQHIKAELRKNAQLTFVV